MRKRSPLIVIVAYRNSSALEKALRDLASRHDVVVVDNGAERAVRELVARYGGEYLTPGRNVGFAAAVNIGSTNRSGRHLLLLNPDARISLQGIDGLVAVLDADRRLCAVSPCLVDETGRPQRVEWPIPSPREEIVKALHLQWLFRPHATFLAGAVLLLNGEALDDVGPFDERYFLYAEECDWQLRALRRGWRLRLVGGIYARHVGGDSSADERVRNRYFSESARLFGLKWYGPRGWAFMRASSVLGTLLRLVVTAPFPKRRARYSRQLRI